METGSSLNGKGWEVTHYRGGLRPEVVIEFSAETYQTPTKLEGNGAGVNNM
jgi:hypothetical protein